MWLCPNCRRITAFPDLQHVWPTDWSCNGCGFIVPHRDGIPCLLKLGESPTGFDPMLLKTLAKTEESNFWFVNRAKLIVFLLQKYFPNADRVLEIGCGTGSILLSLRAAFPQLTLAGSELLPQGLQFARKRLGSNVVLLQMDARLIPAVEEFDVVGAFDVLEHIEEDELVMAQIFAALRPGGGTIIAVPQHPWLWSPADESACHQRRYFRGELDAKLNRAGFRILHSTSFNSLLLPLMIASRMAMILKARSGGGLEPLSELRAADWINRALSAVLRLEVALTSAGIRWPVGGSRLVVAQRPN
jgi:2-polyprenyl-3-methyl-5-hydroxy-6-metoxy-1,4-benzoquinol methylase